ncbi:MAG: response regulator [Sulfurospirillaceae bacterium]|nr:response regulator [Sulfurospirillaceae bacterium]
MEDNVRFATHTLEFLTPYFKTIYHASTIAEARNIFDTKEVHTVLCDVILPDGNGLDCIEYVRSRDSKMPIMVLSAHKDEDFLFKAIPLGLTHYLMKPITLKEFTLALTKINTILENLHQHCFPITATTYVDTTNHILIRDKETKELTPKEVRFLKLVVTNPSIIITKEMIENEVYTDTIMSEAALKNLVLRLRKKINEPFLESVAGEGYRLIK